MNGQPHYIAALIALKARHAQVCQAIDSLVSLTVFYGEHQEPPILAPVQSLESPVSNDGSQGQNEVSK